MSAGRGQNTKARRLKGRIHARSSYRNLRGYLGTDTYHWRWTLSSVFKENSFAWFQRSHIRRWSKSVRYGKLQFPSPSPPKTHAPEHFFFSWLAACGWGIWGRDIKWNRFRFNWPVPNLYWNPWNSLYIPYIPE